MNPWAIVLALVVWAGSLVAVGSWQNDAGHVAERTVWQTRDNNELKLANAHILNLETAYRAAEQQYAQNQADISTKYQKEQQDAKRKTDALFASYRAGTFRLRDPGASGKNTCGGASGQAATGTGGRDGSTTGELSGAAAEFLLGLTGEADAVAIQLSACQAVIVSDRSKK